MALGTMRPGRLRRHDREGDTAPEGVEPHGSNDQTLSRSLGVRHVTLISLGGVIGAGLFVGSSASIAAAGPAITISYLLAGLLLIQVMRMLGEMAVAHPNIQAFTDFIRIELGAAAGFTVGWMYWYLWTVMLAVEAIAGASLLRSWIDLPVWVLGLGLLMAMTGINLTSTRTFGEFEFWLASVKILAIVFFIAIAVGYASGWVGSTAPTWSNLIQHGGFMPRGIHSVAAGITTVFFSLSGAEISTIAAAESTASSTAVAGIAKMMVWRILLFYVGSVLLIVAVVPWEAIVPGVSPFLTALRAMGFARAEAVINLVILSAVLSSLNAGFYVSSRILFSLAANRDAPTWLVTLNARRVPTRAVAFGSLIGAIGVATAAFSPEKVFSFLVNASGALVLLVYWLLCAAYLRYRRARSTGEVKTPYQWLRLAPLTFATMFGIGGVLFAMARTPELASQLIASMVALGLILASYWVSKFYRA